MLERLSNPQLTLARQVELLEDAIKEPLEKVARRLKAYRDQAQYKHFIARPVDITVAGLEKGRLLFFYRRFSVDDLTATFRANCPGAGCGKDGTVAVYSTHPKTNDYIRQLKREFRRYEKSENLEVIARRYVAIAINDNAPGVGGAIDSGRITHAQGITKTVKPECEKYWSSEPEKN